MPWKDTSLAVRCKDTTDIILQDNKKIFNSGECHQRDNRI